MITLKTTSLPCVRKAGIAALFVLALSAAALAQQASLSVSTFAGAPAEPLPAAPAPAVVTPMHASAEQHRFLDTKNRVLFTAVAAFSAADFAVTRSNLQGGGQELNPVTRVFGTSTAGLALNFAGETAGVIGLSYFFHKTGHHKLERLISTVNAGSSATAVGFDLAHR